jgi:hypothetical protein
MNRMLIAGCFALSIIANAAEEKGKTILDPTEGGTDFKIQGEYVSDGGAQKWGAQVIAMGDGRFHAVFEPGGLPGQGWDAKTRYESEGQADDQGKVALQGVDKVAWGDGHIPPESVELKHGFAATIENETLTAKTEAGQTITLKHALRHSAAEGAKPPEGAIVLFDGSNVDAFNGAKIIEDGPWKGFLKEGGETKQKFTDYTLHVEFMLPFKPNARLQGRGNSGVYNQHRYEVQVLDSFGLLGYDNECGGVYTKHPPLVNMCYPPLSWQTYDIEFKAARYKDGQRVSKAVVTVKHNGVLIQDHFEIDGPTGGGKKENPDDDIQTGPLYLQDHHNPVAYRNVWIVEKK